MKKGFREDFKYYKKKDLLPDLNKLINFNTINDSQYIYQKNLKLLNCRKLNINKEEDFGMTNTSQWKVYEFLNKPGLIFIKNPFSAFGQRYWIIKCLEYFTKKPSKLNIDAHDIIKSDEDWWEFCQINRNTKEGAIVINKLRWATFGYHHNWDTKEYSEFSKCSFPPDLKDLCSYLAELLGFSNFNAEAAIVNLYHFGSSLSGHTDHSEVNIKAPLFSFSFGQSAVFLIGGQSIDDEALPILLESGDIIVMSGLSRLCYHGIPRILPTEKQPWTITEKQYKKIFNSEYFSREMCHKIWDNKLWGPFEQYVKKSRININVRQVLLPGQNTLDS